MTAFADLHRPGRPFLLPNAWDVASGRVLARAGFPALGTTSLGVAATAGKPDAAAATLAETLALSEALVGLQVPVTVDIEGGFSDDPGAVAQLAAVLVGMGVAGVNVEDGRPDGSLAPVAQHVAKIEAIKRAAPALFVNARTDVYWQGNRDRDEALARVRAYAGAGADGVFVPGAADLDTVRAICAGVDRPVNVLCAPGGPSVAEYGRVGVARVSTGSLLFREALRAAVALAGLARDGVAPDDPARPTYADIVGES